MVSLSFPTPRVFQFVWAPITEQDSSASLGTLYILPSHRPDLAGQMGIFIYMLAILWSELVDGDKTLKITNAWLYFFILIFVYFHL